MSIKGSKEDRAVGQPVHSLWQIGDLLTAIIYLFIIFGTLELHL